MMLSTLTKTLSSSLTGPGTNLTVPLSLETVIKVDSFGYDIDAMFDHLPEIPP